MGVVLDSAVWISAERKGLSVVDAIQAIRSSVGDQTAVIAAMTAAELIHGIWRADTARVRAQREEFVEEILARIPVQPMTLRVARVVGRLDAEMRKAGRTIPTADLIIGATAMDLEFSVATGNARHYRSIPGLRVVSAL
ncbi:MAG TPA: PIN domain-containing protein [Bryobacteraceae bacterium]|nr:PIN domain-containing protein [Bryobacteraceae bacterium]